MLNFEEFQEFVKEHIRKFLPEELKTANVSLSSITKNNGKNLSAILVRPEESYIAPTVYLNEYFNQYENGADLTELMKEIAKITSQNQVKDTFEDFVQNFQNFDAIKDRIVMALVNAEKNQEMLQTTPHLIKEDLAIIYKVMVDMDGVQDGISTVIIHNSHMECWGQDIETLHNLAMENSNRLLPATVLSMDEIMMGVLGEVPEEMAELMSEHQVDEQMFVVSNKNQVNGASAIIYSDALSQLAEKFKSDVYILPSSIHECIAISVNMGSPEMLAQMVQEINAMEVDMAEQLSDHVYHYDAKAKTLSLADTTAKSLMVSENQTQAESYTRPRRHR